MFIQFHWFMLIVFIFCSNLDRRLLFIRMHIGHRLQWNCCIVPPLLQMFHILFWCAFAIGIEPKPKKKRSAINYIMITWKCTWKENEKKTDDNVVVEWMCSGFECNFFFNGNEKWRLGKEKNWNNYYHMQR